MILYFFYLIFSLIYSQWHIIPLTTPVDCGGPDLGTHPKQIYRNLGIEISSLPYTAQRDKIQDFLRRNANVCVDMKELAEEIKYVSSRTLTRWMSEIRKSAQGQPLFPAVASQGMALNVVVHNAAHPSLMLGHARQHWQTGSISSYAVRAHSHPPCTAGAISAKTNR